MKEYTTEQLKAEIEKRQSEEEQNMHLLLTSAIRDDVKLLAKERSAPS